MIRVEYLLSERTNPNSRVRGNGVRWWGHPQRRGGSSAIRVIGIHTTENDPSPAVTLNVARWQAYTAPDPSSYHVLADSDHLVRTVLDTQVAFHIAGFNTPSLGLSFGTRAALWGRYPDWDEAALLNGAEQAREWVEKYDIPVRWITRAQALNGESGFVRHSVMDPDRRGDPGRGFPSQTFFDMIRNGKPKEPKRTWMEKIMEAGEKQLADIATALKMDAEARYALAQVEVARYSAGVREDYGHDPDPESDAVWGVRVASKSHDLRDVTSALSDK